jgi:hypothetical protein
VRGAENLPAAALFNVSGPVVASTVYLSSAGAHTLHVRLWANITSVLMQARAGGAGNFMPGVIWVEVD